MLTERESEVLSDGGYFFLYKLLFFAKFTASMFGVEDIQWEIQNPDPGFGQSRSSLAGGHRLRLALTRVMSCLEVSELVR